METTWKVDTMHSEVGFKVRHMMISNVSGSFGTFDANVATEGDDFTTAQFSFNADIASINTGVSDRDGHLKSADFFDAENHPSLTFSAQQARQFSGGACARSLAHGDPATQTQQCQASRAGNARRAKP